MSTADAPEALFARLLERPPSPDREFWCHVCDAALRGRSVTIDERGRATCRDCTGREPEKENQE